MENHSNNNTNATTFEVEPYKLSEIFSIVPEFDGDQIFLTNFLNACDCAYRMATSQQKLFLVIHIKNKLRGRAAQLVSSRDPQTYPDIKQLLNLHFGDSRDFTSLIQDLQRLKQLSGESPLTFFNRLQVLNAKLHSSIQKSGLNKDQKDAQTILIETMALNTLLTGLEPRLGQLIRASNPTSLVEAQNRIRRELQLSYLENQKSSNNPKPIQPLRNIPNNVKCSVCNRIGHSSSQCRNNNNSYRPNINQNLNSNFSRPNTNSFQQNRPNYPGMNQNNSANFQRNTSMNFQPRPQNITQVSHNNQNQTNIPNRNFNQNSRNRNFNQNFQNRNFNNNQNRTHHINYDDYVNYCPDNFNDTPYNNYQNQVEIPEEFPNNFQNTDNYEDFPELPHNLDPPINTFQEEISQLETQIQSLNLDNMNPNVNSPDQQFI